MTRLAGVIGDPVAHSLSPAIHNAAYDAAGLDWHYVAFHVPRGRATDALTGMRALGLGGLNVTMPHKQDVARACDELSDEAAALQSVNTVVPLPGRRLRGLSTDGPGLVRALQQDGVEVGDRSVVVLGAGGAARAVAYSLATGAGARVQVWARRAEASAAVTRLAPQQIVAVAPEELAGAIGAAAVVINATPLGMGGEAPPFEPALLHSGQVVVDLVYRPAVTPLLAAAAEHGARPVNGMGMLVHQAALAFEHFTGVTAPLAAMRAAAEMADSD